MTAYHSHSEQEFDEIQYQIEQSRKRRLERRRKRMKIRRIRILSAAAFLLIIAIAVIALALRGEDEPPAEEPPVEDSETVTIPVEELPTPVYTVERTSDTAQINADFPSQYAVVIDADSGLVLAEKESQTIMNPASMTKILTLLVAVENITDWEQTFTMHIGITDYCFVNGCSVVGYELDEVIPVRELLYGCI